MNNAIYERFFINHPSLLCCKDSIFNAYELMKEAYEAGKKTMICGNGGSASDSEHIVGELMKGFILPRHFESTSLPGRKLQRGLPAISLISQTSLISAIANDNGADLVYAQQVLGYGVAGDIFIGLSTSGNSANVINAAKLSNELGVKTIGLTGKDGGELKGLCDVCICVPERDTYLIQERHLEIYHLICMMLEYHFFG